MSALIDLLVERPVAGGRMLARHEGRVVFVSGAIPGERVRARIERAQKRTLWAETVDVLDASPDRREPYCESGCGGSVYAHIQYARQRQLKGDVIADAFRRVGKIVLPCAVEVAASSEDGYRLRARLHRQGARWGFVREGSHTVCDAGATRQLLPETMRAVEHAAGEMQRVRPSLYEQASALVIAENVDATERVLHWEMPATVEWPAEGARPDVAGLTGMTASRAGEHPRVLAGDAWVTDTACQLFGAQAPVAETTRWRRRATSFFQGNRHLIGALVRRVLEASAGDHVVDLYAGVGLFAVAMAAGGAHVMAVEGDDSSSVDLIENAMPLGARLRVMHASVESALGQRPSPRPDVVVLDPPRTGMSGAALDGLIGWRVPRLVYVSCDPPTLARDSGRLVAAGYARQKIDALDLFPNTAHVECVAVFQSR